MFVEEVKTAPADLYMNSLAGVLGGAFYMHWADNVGEGRRLPAGRPKGRTEAARRAGGTRLSKIEIVVYFCVP